MITSVASSSIRTVGLFTIGTCGVGLNLQMFSVMIFLDIAWSKALEDQAVARIYRFGQTKKGTIVYSLLICLTFVIVYVYKLIADYPGSIDTRILEVQNFKEKFSTNLLGGTLSTQRLWELLDLNEPAVEQ